MIVSARFEASWLPRIMRSVEASAFCGIYTATIRLTAIWVRLRPAVNEPQAIECLQYGPGAENIVSTSRLTIVLTNESAREVVKVVWSYVLR